MLRTQSQRSTRSGGNATFRLPQGDLCEGTQGRVHRSRIRECGGDIRIQQDNVRAFRVSLRVFSANAAAKIVFGQHLVGIYGRLPDCSRPFRRP